MKRFLADLKKELQKNNFKAQEISEILEDHKEMIETAKSEGLTDAELQNKFGNPQQLAKDLKDNNTETTVTLKKGGSNVRHYKLLKAFPIIDQEFDVHFQLVSDDVKYELHDLEQIEVYYKDIRNINDYECTFERNEFLLKYNRTFKMGFRTKSGHFIVRMPAGVVSEKFIVQGVSSDFDFTGITTGFLDVKSTSGDITLTEFKVKKGSLTTVSGDVEFRNGNGKEMAISLVSGDAEFTNVNCDNEVDINTVSGDLEATNCYFGPLTFKSVSGDLEGKDFYPKSIAIRSVSGDVDITNEDHSFVIDIIRNKTLSGDVNIK